ncbi:MAG TPA: type IV toxin-antitoxin system AbiEi family antitoxin domain-containing protein [Acidimicrobiia bacterium]|nr:type IV toxin-antitoxin system AbiEi family antitoxin domain-containing protein [Acidimicrobiia bacterium]
MGGADLLSHAGRQHGLFTTAEADERGVSRAVLERWCDSGACRRVRHGVYAVVGAPATWEQSVVSAILAAGPGAVASHTTAAVVWGLPNLERETTEISTDRRRRARLPGIRAHRTVAFLSEEHTVRNGIPVTTVARTLVDLSGRLSVAQLGIITDDALRRGTLTLRELQRCVAGLPGARGRKPTRIRSVLAQRVDGYDPGDSALELRVLRAIVAAGLPEPVQQHEVAVASRRCRLDLAYPADKLAIEVDGFEPHRHRSAFDRDRSRANDLVVAGWTVLRFTSEFSDAQIVRTVTATLAALGQKRGA